MNDNDWLDTEPGKAVELKQRPEYQKALVAMSALTAKQRLFLDCLIDSQLEPDAARKLMRKRHRIHVRRAEQNEWLAGDENFGQALQSLQSFACSAVAVSKAALLAKLNKLANDTRRLIPFKDKQGNEFLRPVDAGAAHSALVSLAKLTGTLAPDARTTVNNNAPTFIYQVIGSQGEPGRVIEGEALDATPAAIESEAPKT